MHWEGLVNHLLNPGILRQAWFMSEPLRRAAATSGRVDWNPMSLSTIPEFLNTFPPDAVFAHVAPPVAGHVSLGTNCDVISAGLRAALEHARRSLRSSTR